MVETIFILDEHYKTSKVLTVNGKNNFFDDCYSMDLSTGVESYEFSTNVQDLDEKHYVMFKYHDEFKLFQITEIEQEHNEGKIITYCYGESACLELLNDVVRAFSGSFNCIQFLQYVLEGTGWSIGNYSSSLEEKVLEVDVSKTTQKWSCIQDYMSSYGYELNTRVLYENGHVVAKKLDVYEEGQLGKMTHKRFEYGRNVKGIVKKKDLYEWCTALIIDSDVSVSDIEFKQDEYHKPAGSDVIYAPNENRMYNVGRDYIYANFEDKSPSGEEAVENALAELKRRATPHFDYECTTIMTYKEFEEISLGDTVLVVDHSFNPIVTLEARVGKLEVSFTDRNACKCNLTNYKEIKSRINVELTGTVTEIIDKYFPVTSEGIADGAIVDGKIETKYYQQITADIVSASKLVAEELIAEHAFIFNGRFEELEANDATIENLITTNFESVNAKIENLNATKATIEELNATNATIETLKASKADIKDLNATNATIETLKTKDATIENLINTNLESTNAKIENLRATKADIDVLEADYATIKDLQAVDAKIGDLDVGELSAIKGDIKELEAATANIGLLSADVADIKTLMGGSASTGSIQTIRLTAANTTIDNALIQDAAIANVSAGKLTAGSIDTNSVSLASNDGSMILSGSLQQFKDENGRVRIQMGKDGDGKFTLAILDKYGYGTLFDENGITEKGIGPETIVDANISANAQIDGNKLNIKSVISNINDSDSSEETGVWIKASKIIFDDYEQTLEVGFNKIEKTVDQNQTYMYSMVDQIILNKNEIKTLKEKVEIEGDDDGTITSITNSISEIQQTLDGINTTVGTLQTNYNEVSGEVESVSNKQTTLEQDVDSFKISVSTTYATKDSLDDLEEELTAKINNVDIEISEDQITSIVSKSYYSKAEVDNNIKDSLDSMEDSLISNMENNYVGKTDIGGIVQEETSSQMSQTSEMIEMKFNETQLYTSEVQQELIQYKVDVETNIRFSNDGIELGKSNSPFKTVLDNDRLAFYQDNTVIAYINNNKMNITNAEIKDELTLGNLSWVNSNGHLRLRKG